MWVRGKMENWRQSEEQTSVSAVCKEEEQYGSVNQQHLKAPRAEAASVRPHRLKNIHGSFEASRSMETTKKKLDGRLSSDQL